jgi:predicted nucleic acid-binding protein
MSGAKALEAEYRPLVEARKAMKEGRRADAFKLAFGEDINDFQRAALREELSADAGTTRLQNELQALRRELEEVKTGKSQRTPEVEEADQRAVEVRGKDRIFEALQKSEDAEVRKYGRKTAFVERVWEIRLQHFEPSTKTTIPMHLAAEIARDETRAMLRSWDDDHESPGSSVPNSESPALAGNEPVRTSPRARSPNPSQAAGGGIATGSMSRDDRIRAYARAMGG